LFLLYLGWQVFCVDEWDNDKLSAHPILSKCEENRDLFSEVR
jgi:hypothetical protein